MIALNKPLTPNIEKLSKYLNQVNESGWYTNFGPLHELLTKRLEDYLGVSNLLLVSNGTLAIQVAAKVLNINSAITTPFSFAATSSSLLWQGIEVAFSDINLHSYNLCPKALEHAFEQDNNYDGIVATHVYGNPCDVASIAEVANKYNKKVIYDAAHAFGIKIRDKSVLNYGDASTLSFHATKVFHTVEGGAIIFKNKIDFEKAKQLINFGINTDGSLGEPGINAKLNEYQCAVGLTLLDDIESIIEYRVSLLNTYIDELKSTVDIPQWHKGASLNGSYMPIYISSSNKLVKIMQKLSEHNIQYRRYFNQSLDLAYSQQKSFGCNISQNVSNGILCLPLHYGLTKQDVLKVCSVIKKALVK